MTFTLSLLIGLFQAAMVLSYGRISDSPASDLVRLLVILLTNALIPFYWIYKNEEMKEYAKGFFRFPEELFNNLLK